MQQRVQRSRLRYDVTARLNANIIATLHLWHSEEFQRQASEGKRASARDSNAREQMIDSVLKALALTALASIAIGAVQEP